MFITWTTDSSVQGDCVMSQGHAVASPANKSVKQCFSEMNIDLRRHRCILVLYTDTNVFICWLMQSARNVPRLILPLLHRKDLVDGSVLKSVTVGAAGWDAPSKESLKRWTNYSCQEKGILPTLIHSLALFFSPWLVKWVYQTRFLEHELAIFAQCSLIGK